MTLTPVEARVLGTLMEKARTVPDSYPLTLNTLLLGCNQKTSRDPLMELDEAQLADALDSLKAASLVRESSGGRTTRYEHNFQRGVGVPEQSAVLLGLLMLRGPQTAGELRLNAERWHRFADISSVEAFLEELQDRAAEKGGALVAKLARAPGTREQCWAQSVRGNPMRPRRGGQGCWGRRDAQALAGALASGATPPSALGYPGPAGEAPKQAHSLLQSLAGGQPRLRFAPRLDLFWGLTRVHWIASHALTCCAVPWTPPRPAPRSHRPCQATATCSGALRGWNPKWRCSGKACTD